MRISMLLMAGLIHFQGCGFSPLETILFDLRLLGFVLLLLLLAIALGVWRK
jgi:hypothetical protein